MEYEAPVGLFGIDDDERARRRRDEAAQVIEIRHPAPRRDRSDRTALRAELGDHRRVQRVGRHRHQHIAVFVEERAQDELDAFGGAGREEHAVGRDREAVRRVLGRDRFAAGGDARRRAVAVVSVAQRPFDGGDEVRRRVETESDRIADVQIPHALAAGFDPLRLRDDIANGVGKAVNARGDGDRREESSW